MTLVNPNATEWIAVDWGTSNLRVWIMGADNRPIAQTQSDRGMGGLQPNQFEPALMSLIGDFLPENNRVPVLCCGMVGSRQGWVEADYQAVPCAPPSAMTATRVIAQDPRIAVYVLPGVKQDSPADVMRGEETQIAGLLHHDPEFDGVVCLPGTHTKWAHISAKEIVSFRTFMTGELFSLLSKQSVLRHSVTTQERGDGAWDDGAFETAIQDAMTSPQSMATYLFSIRARDLLTELSPASARARLSGLLIGMELAGARPYWLGQNVAIIGADANAELYRSGLLSVGLDATIVVSREMTLAGLISAYNTLKEKIK